MDVSPYYIRMRVPAWMFGSGVSPLTKLYPAFSSNSYISIVHFLVLLQTIPQLRSGTALLQKRNMKRNRRTEIASGGRYEE